MPDRLSYDEAMLYSQKCLKIQDPDLLQGSVETFSIKTSVGEMKRPWGIEGGFAVVYKFRAHSGQMKAMRCFRVAMNPDTQSRYEKMSAYFHRHIPDITIDFRYFEDGILVKESVYGADKKVCPVIVMEWIEGATLLDKVDELCGLRDTEALGLLAEDWLKIIDSLRQAHVAHGDLAAVNVMARKNGKLALVDYDGVFIPEFSGLPQVVLGQQGYQHPDMDQRPFNEKMDDFSALVIYVSLLALKTQPELWDRHVRRARGQLDGNMLFSREDFLDPDASPIFTELLGSSDLRVRDLSRALKDACLKPNGTMSFPIHLLDPDYLNKQALQDLARAVDQQDDERIIKLWEDTLSTYTPAQRYQQDVNEARKRAAAMAAFHSALFTCNVFRIADAATLQVLKKVNSTDRKIAELAIAFVEAYRKDDENRMVDCWEEIQHSPVSARLMIDAQQRSRLALAVERKNALTNFRKAIYLSGYQKPKAFIIQGAYTKYATFLDDNPGLSNKEQELLAGARAYTTMFYKIKRAIQEFENTKDLKPFQKAYDENLDNDFFDDFSEHERRQITNLINLGKVERALEHNYPQLALATAKKIEENSLEDDGNSTTIVFDNRLNQIREKLARDEDAKNVKVKFQHGKAYASWDWPENPLFQRAVVVWRYDRWPEPPQTPDPGREMLWVLRRNYEPYKHVDFKIGMARQVFIQVYLVIEGSAGAGQHEPVYYFTPGNESTSRFTEKISF